MSSTGAIQAPAQTSSGKMLRAMVGIGILCALMIVLTFEGTLPRIEKLRAEALERAIFRVIPGADTKVAFRLDPDGTFVKATGEEENAEIVYAGYGSDGQLLGIAIEGSGMGYADVIRILYGYDPERQQVIGFYVLESKETPGLGDKIEKDPTFLANFEALDVALNASGSDVKNRVVTVKSGEKENPWEVDGITGATISSRTIGDILAASTSRWAPLIKKNEYIFRETE